MTESTGFGPDEVVREQLAARAAADPPVDAGASVEQMQADSRSVLLPMEAKINEMMAAFQSQQDTQATQIRELQAALAAAQASTGAPAVELYAGGVAILLQRHADANPDLGPDAFRAPLAVAAQLKDEATAAVTSRDASRISELAGSIEGWVARFRGKHLDFSALLADLELLGEAASRLAV